MGNYNSKYEDYYNCLKRENKIRNSPYQYNSYNIGKIGGSRENYWIRRITRELVGVLILFVFVIGCKVIVTPQTQTVYNYSRKVLDQNYNYTALIEKAKSIDLNKLQDDFTSIIERVRSKLTGKETTSDKIKNEFVLPLEGVETSPYGYREDPITKQKKLHAGIDIDAKQNTQVKASYDGKIKNCGEDGQLGKYILIDHGDGVETKYAHLNEILIKKEDAVKKSQVIAKSGNTGKSTGPHLHFELLYMGENKDPNEYFNIIKK